MVVVLVREHHRVQRRKAREVEPSGRKDPVVERVLRAELLAQQRIHGDARPTAAKEPALMTEEGGGEHGRASCHKRVAIVGCRKRLDDPRGREADDLERRFRELEERELRKKGPR